MKRSVYLLVVLVAALSLVAPVCGENVPPPTKNVPAKDSPLKTVPVTFDGSPIFSVQAYKGFTAEERAEGIGERIRKIAEDQSIPTGVITSVESDVSTDVVAGERVIMSVFDKDALPTGRTRQELAAEFAGKISAAVENYRKARAPKSIMHGVVLSVIATLLLLAAVLVLRVLFRRLLAVVEATKVPSIHFQKFQILRLDQVKTLLIGGIRGVRLLVILVLFYLYVHFTLSFFPWTRPVSGQILYYLLVPFKTMEGWIVGYIPNLIFLVVLALVTYYVLKFMRLFAAEVGKGNITFPGFYPDWARPTFKIARFLFIAFVAVVAFPYFPGSQSPAFKGITIFIGVLLSLGSSSTVSNIIAGLDMTYRRAFVKGDWIKIGDLTGEVIRMRLLVTHLRTFKNEEVVFPNAFLLNSHVTNFSFLAREQGLILHTSVTIGYSTPWRQVHAFLLQAAEKTPGLLRNPAPFVLQTALDDFYVRYELNAYTDAPQEMLNIYSDLHQNIQDAFNEFEVQIMSPHYVFDPRSPVVVPRGRWYEPPAKPVEEKGDAKDVS
ncbi:MAG TPA: mechanosensitive ion channel family protein [Geobacteraceae bacterium]|nr:mechanosensitive ion channel family protein [Geobacteraceae bacterium]